VSSIPELLVLFRGNQTALAKELGIDRNTVRKYAHDKRCRFHTILNGKLMTAKTDDELIDLQKIKDTQQLANMERDHEQLLNELAQLEEQIREVKNRLQGVTKREFQR